MSSNPKPRRFSRRWRQRQTSYWRQRALAAEKENEGLCAQELLHNSLQGQETKPKPAELQCDVIPYTSGHQEVEVIKVIGSVQGKLMEAFKLSLNSLLNAAGVLSSNRVDSNKLTNHLRSAETHFGGVVARLNQLGCVDEVPPFTAVQRNIGRVLKLLVKNGCQMFFVYKKLLLFRTRVFEQMGRKLCPKYPELVPVFDGFQAVKSEIYQAACKLLCNTVQTLLQPVLTRFKVVNRHLSLPTVSEALSINLKRSARSLESVASSCLLRKKYPKLAHRLIEASNQLEEAIECLPLRDVTFKGHLIVCSLITNQVWSSLLEVYGDSRPLLNKLKKIFSRLLAWAEMTGDERSDIGRAAKRSTKRKPGDKCVEVLVQTDDIQCSCSGGPSVGSSENVRVKQEWGKGGESPSRNTETLNKIMHLKECRIILERVSGY